MKLRQTDTTQDLKIGHVRNREGGRERKEGREGGRGKEEREEGREEEVGQGKER